MKDTLKTTCIVMIVFGVLFLSNTKPKGPLTLTYEIGLVVGGVLGIAFLRYGRSRHEAPGEDPSIGEQSTQTNEEVPDLSTSKIAKPSLITRFLKFLLGMVIRFFVVVILLVLALFLAGLRTTLREHR
jgi:Na+/glutamate symporter